MNQLETLLKESFELRKLTPSLYKAIEREAVTNGLPQQQVIDLTHRCFEWAKNESANTDHKLILEWLHECVLVLNQALDKQLFESIFAPEGDIRTAALHYINKASFSIDLCMYILSDDILSDAILLQHENGVMVRIICDDAKSFDAGSDVRKLAKVGIEVKTDGTPELMHHKFAVIDEKIVLNGSYNWTRTAAEKNYENLLVIENQVIARTFSNEFSSLWNTFKPIDKTRFKR